MSYFSRLICSTNSAIEFRNVRWGIRCSYQPYSTVKTQLLFSVKTQLLFWLCPNCRYIYECVCVVSRSTPHFYPEIKERSLFTGSPIRFREIGARQERKKERTRRDCACVVAAAAELPPPVEPRELLCQPAQERRGGGRKQEIERASNIISTVSVFRGKKRPQKILRGEKKRCRLLLQWSRFSVRCYIAEKEREEAYQF